MLTELLYQPIPQLKLLPPPPILLPEEPQLFIPDMSMDTLDGHMVTSLVSVKPNLTQLSMFSEELQSPLLEPSPLMLTEPSSQLTPAVAAATAQHLAAKGTPILHDTYATVAHVGYAGYPFAHYGHYLGKREAESDAEAYYGVYGLGFGYGLHHVPAVTSVGGLTTYSNGAVVPTDPANLAATSALLAEKAHRIGLLG